MGALGSFRRNLVHRFMKSVLSDEQFSQYWNYKLHGRFLDLNRPKTFNEKLHWLKINYRHPLIRQCSDKLGVRNFAVSRIGAEYLVPLYSVCSRPSDLLWSELPAELVLKCNHGSGYNILVKDSAALDKRQAVATLSRWLKEDYSNYYREWNYRGIKPLVMCEQMLKPHESDCHDLKDYKIFCFGGVPTYVQVDSDRFTNHTRQMFDTSWNALPVRYQFPLPARPTKKPDVLQQMLELAASLSEPFPFARVDLYRAETGIFLGEISFYAGAAYEVFDPPEFDVFFGEKLQLPKPYPSR